MILALLAILSYALYTMAEGYNITPWKWIRRYVGVFFGTFFLMMLVIVGFVYSENSKNESAAVQKITDSLLPLILSYQVALFFFFRTRIVRYVHDLDQIDKDNNNNKFPDSPGKDKKDKQDFSYFR